MTGPTVEQALDELDGLAAVEHALMVEYLSIYYAIMPPRDATGSAAASGPVSEAALTLARAEMRHLHSANRTLTQAGRPAQVGRAATIDVAGSPTAFRKSMWPKAWPVSASDVSRKRPPISG